jgi:dipeptidyl aminopeptidase/acylaminoacyl peptidase
MKAALVTALAAFLLTDAFGQEPAAPVVRSFAEPGGAGTFAASVYPPLKPAKNAGLVIHLYGSGGSHVDFNVARPPYADLRRSLAERGYWLVTPELGPKHWMSETAAQKVKVVIDEMVKLEGVDPRRVHLLGTSMGGGSSLIFAMRHPGVIRSVVAIFPMTDFSRWFTERPGYRQPFEAAHGIEAASRERVLRELSPLHHPESFRETPVFLLHGLRDTVVPPHHSADFAAALRTAGGTVIHREAKEAAHSDTIATAYQAEIAEFLTRDAP